MLRQKGLQARQSLLPTPAAAPTAYLSGSSSQLGDRPLKKAKQTKIGTFTLPAHPEHQAHPGPLINWERSQ